MASTAAEAASLDAAMGRVNRTFDDNQKKTVASAEAIIRARGEVELLRREQQRAQQEYVNGQERVNEAEARARDIVRDHRDDLDALREAHVALNRAEADAEALKNRAIESYERYHAKVIAVRQEVERFNEAHIGATAGFRNMRNEAEKMGAALESVTEKLAGIARIMGQAGLFGLFGGAAGGSLFATGAGGLHLLAGAMAVVVEVGQDLIGLLALAPAAIQGAVLAFGTLAIAMHGVGEALSSIGDPTKFIAAIRDMSPAMQQVMLSVQSFTSAMRGARDAVQESFATQIVNDIQPLIRTWLPLLMQAGQAIATEWGQAFHQVFQFFQTPEAQQGFQTFVKNLTAGFQAARAAIQPLLQAWTTLATVGSQVFPRLGTAIAHVAEVFNNWIQRSAENGNLLSFINKALDGFTNIGHIIRDVALGISNVFGIFQNQNGSTLQILANISAQFRSWTESLQGQSAIGNFFNLLHTAARAVQPQLVLLGQALAIVGRTLTVLGIAIQPGLNSFFTSFAEALRNLAPFIIQLAPAINEFLTAFGQTLLQVVNSVGPKLPGFFQDMADAFVQVMQILPPIVDAFANLMSHLTPTEVEAILGLVLALKLLGGTLPIISAGIKAVNIAMDLGPIGLFAIAIAGLVAAGILLYQNWDTVKEKVGEVTSKFGGLSGILGNLKRAWDSVTEAVSKFWRDLTGGITGGWNVVMRGIGNLGATIRDYFSGLWDEAVDWGTRLVTNFSNGITNAIGTTLQPAIDAVASLIPDSWKTRSPAKRGPLSQMSPEEMGTRLVTQYAAGMVAGRPSVDSAASSVAGSASGIGSGGGGAGFGSTSFTSGGVSGKSGQDFTQGQSGFDQWVSFITKDLTAWNNIARGAFDLVSSVSDIVVNTIKVAASIWGGGDNPLTRPGGIAGPPQAANQQTLFGVPNKPIPGKAPIPELAPLGGGPTAAAQETIPGVPNKPIPGTGRGGTPPANPPASTTGQAPANGALAVSGQAGTGIFGPSPVTAPGAPPATTTGAAPGDTPLAAALRAKGFDNEQIRLIQGFSQVEGDNPAGNPTLGFTDDQLGGDTSLQGHVDALAQQFKDRASVAGPFPSGGTDQQQAQWIANVVGQAGVESDWQGNAQPKDYVNRVTTAMQAVSQAPPPAPPTGAPRGAIPGAAVNPATQANFPLSGTTTNAFKASGDSNPPLYTPGSDTGGYGGPGQNVLPDWVKQMADKFGLVASTYPEGGTLHEAGYAFDFVPKPGVSQEEGVQAMDAFSNFIQQNLAPQTLELIHFNERTGQKWGIAGAKDVAGTGYYESPNAFGAHGDYGSGAHVHWATDVPPQLPGINAPAQDQTPPPASPLGTFDPTGTPRPAGITPGGFHIPSDGATLAVGALAGLGGLAVLAGMGSRAKLKWLQFNYDRLDAKAKADVINSLTPEERALVGRNPEVAFGADGVRSPQVRGLIMDLGGTPPEPGASGLTGSAADIGANGVAGSIDANRLRQLVSSGRMSPAEAARINPNLMVDVYHATDEAGARGILNEGFRVNPEDPGRMAYFATDLRNARVNAGIYGSNVLHAQVPASAFDPTFAGGARVPAESLKGVQFSQLTPEQLGLTDVITPGRGAAALGNTVAYNPFATDTGIPTARPPATSTGAEPASVQGGAPRGGIGRGLLRGLGTAADVVGVPLMINQTGQVVQGRQAGPLTGAAAVAAPVIIGGSALAAGSAAGVGALPSILGAGVLGAISTATGSATGQESTRTPGVIYGPDGRVISAGPRAPQASIFGGPGAQAERRGSQPVHVTNANELPGGSQSTPVRPTGLERPLGTPQPGQPGFVGPVQTQLGGPPGAQAQRRGTPEVNAGGAAGQSPFSSRNAGTTDAQAVPGADTRTPLDKFTDGMQSVGSIASDAFTIFQDVIESIGAAANITDTLVRGFENTESVVGFIQQFQTFIKTGADIAKLVGDVGGVVGGAGAGDPTGMTSAIGGAISAISGIVQSALSATNAAISLGIDIYHEVGKYAGFIMGGFLGGDATGPLGGNVRMLLNTRTNQLQTYSEDNPLNKNTFDVPQWQRSYNQQATPPSLPPQVNIYTGPGQTPAGMMQESMWMVSTGSAPVASVAGHD